jgi:putative exporter of polyketide antibiotics
MVKQLTGLYIKLNRSQIIYWACPLLLTIVLILSILQPMGDHFYPDIVSALALVSLWFFCFKGTRLIALCLLLYAMFAHIQHIWFFGIE